MARAGHFGELVGFIETALGFLRSLVHVGTGRSIAGSDEGKIFFHFGEDFVGLNVANHGEDGVVGSVILLVKRLDVGNFGCVKIFELAVKIVRVGIGVESLARKIDGEKESVGTVENVDPDFLFHDIALVFEILGGEIEGLHAIGLDPENGIERGDGGGLNVFGEVVAGVAVIVAAAAFDDAIEARLWGHWACLQTSCARRGERIRCGLRVRGEIRCHS